MIVILGATGIFEYLFLLLNQAQASNNYIENIKFYCEDNIPYSEFFVTTTFSAVKQLTIGYVKVGYIKDYNPSPSSHSLAWNVPKNYTFTAGNTYKLITYVAAGVTETCSNLDNYSYIIFNRTDTPFSPNFTDQEKYYFTEYPSLSLDYPEDEMEIAGDFNITGNITMPDPYEYNKIRTQFYWYDENNPDNTFNNITGFIHNLTATSTQEFSIPIENLPKSDPKYIGVKFSLMSDTAETYYFDDQSIKIKTMYEIGTWPPTTPTGPNIFSFFNIGAIDIYHPGPRDDGAYHINTPTSTITFIISQEMRADNNIWIHERLIGGNQETIYATSTIGDLTGTLFEQVWSRTFEIDDVFAETSTPAWLSAVITSQTGELIAENHWLIKGLEEDDEEDIHWLWGILDPYLNQTIRRIFFIQEDTKQAFYSIGDIIKTKIPLCYFYQIKNIFDEINLTEEKTPLPAIAVEIGGYDYDINILNTDFLEEIGFIENFKDLQRVVLWGIFLIYLIMLGKAGPKQLQMNY